MDNYNYPMGADGPDAPWNEKEAEFCELCDKEQEDCTCDPEGDRGDWLYHERKDSKLEEKE